MSLAATPEDTLLKFTDRQQKVFGLAGDFAKSRGHNRIEPEDILAGLIKEGAGVAANLIKNLDVDLSVLLKALEKEVKRDAKPNPTDKKLAFSRASVEVIEVAKRQARDFGFQFVGSELVFYALTAVEGTVAHRVLNQHRLTADNVLYELNVILGLLPRDESKFEPPSEAVANPAKEVPAKDLTVDQLKKSIVKLPVSDRRLLYQFIGESLEGLGTYVGRNQTELEDPSDLVSIPNAAKRINIPEEEIRNQIVKGFLRPIVLGDGYLSVRLSDCELFWPQAVKAKD